MTTRDPIYEKLGNIEATLDYIKIGIDDLKTCQRDTETRLSTLEHRYWYYIGISTGLATLITSFGVMNFLG
jgi:hypothetical protein